MVEKLLRKIAWYSLITLIMVVAIGVMLLYKGKVNEPVSLGGGGLGDFAATSTHFTNNDTWDLIREGSGTLGRVRITKAPQNAFVLYDATTTNANLRTGRPATTSLPVLASFPASATVGTYDFDAVYSLGLLYTAGGMTGTTTILYK